MRLCSALAAMFVIGLTGPALPQEAPRLAKLIEVSSGKSALTRVFFGTVAARETVDLSFQVGGQIVAFPVTEGEPIAEGGLIAMLDLEPFELSLDQARVEKEQADRTLDRLKKLEGNTVSQVSVDDAETQSSLAAIAVRNAERSLRNATLKAPFAGLVARRHVPNFSAIAAGTAVVRLHDMSDLRVEIDVPEVLFQKAGEDPDVDLWAKFPASNRRFELEPREFTAETSDVGQTFRITLGMTPPDDIVVLPGSSVEVTATLNQAGDTILIPASAVLTGNDGQASVMVFTPAGAEEGTVSHVPIEIAPLNTGAIRVVSGLEPGQEIVASGAAMLRDGDAVKRFTAFPN